MIEFETDRSKQITELETIKQIIQASCQKYNETLRSIFLRTLIDQFFEQVKYTQEFKFKSSNLLILDSILQFSSKTASFV